MPKLTRRETIRAAAWTAPAIAIAAAVPAAATSNRIGNITVAYARVSTSDRTISMLLTFDKPLSRQLDASVFHFAPHSSAGVYPSQTPSSISAVELSSEMWEVELRFAMALAPSGTLTIGISGFNFLSLSVPHNDS